MFHYNTVFNVVLEWIDYKFKLEEKVKTISRLGTLPG